MRFVAFLGLLVPSAQGYSEGSHQAVAFAAFNYLSDTSKDFVQAALNVGDRADVAQTMMDVSSWADRMGNTTVPGSADWHYHNAPADFVTYAPNKCEENGCLVWALAEQVAIAADDTTSPEALEQALKFVIHFVADLHQPLHVGRASDDGGNVIGADLEESVNKRLDRHGKGTLHKIWDLALPEYASLRERNRTEPAAAPRSARKDELFPKRSPAEVGLDLTATMEKDEKDAATLRGLNLLTIDDRNFLETLFGSVAVDVHHTGLASAYQTQALKSKLGKLEIDEKYLELHLPTLQGLLRDASWRLGQVLNTIASARATKGLAASSAAAPPVADFDSLVIS